MTFKLDTSGSVLDIRPYGGVQGRTHIEWSDLTPFAQGYVEAAMQALGTELRHDPGRYLDGGSNVEYIGEELAFHMLASESLGRIIADCDRYLGQTSILPHQVTPQDGRDFYTLRQTAPDYLNGPAMSQTLEGEPVASVYYFPPQTVTLGADGKVHLSNKEGPSDGR